ncbi:MULTISPECIES: D-Ala-D-Ala carboxypeptidase family metallohydrolase [Flavobacteriaceae]|uniref:YcbK family protein n=1 Tax=Flavobacteriaceae TaxID=49546 RepID=UPI00149306F7|nr:MULTISPECIES: D-Ala-D-Ala carboxypeptidase family metallohydrolase [Allomuricauda]MDC6364709.1 D-Ala-D-Ala carboxypeptidase family metallohydrolase [Muricauda sp. AC10]
MQLTKNFYKIEFESRDGATMPESVFQNVKQLAENLQIVRDILEEPININSGYRSEAHNTIVGGVKNSQHLLGKAADISMKNYTSKELAVIFENLIREGKIQQGGVGLYNGFVHYDIRGTRARWNFSTKYKDFFE